MRTPLNIDKVRKNINIVIVIIFYKFQNKSKIVWTKKFESAYYGFYFIHIWSTCDLPIYYRKFTMKYLTKI